MPEQFAAYLCAIGAKYRWPGFWPYKVHQYPIPYSRWYWTHAWVQWLSSGLSAGNPFPVSQRTVTMLHTLRSRKLKRSIVVWPSLPFLACKSAQFLACRKCKPRLNSFNSFCQLVKWSDLCAFRMPADQTTVQYYTDSTVLCLNVQLYTLYCTVRATRCSRGLILGKNMRLATIQYVTQVCHRNPACYWGQKLRGALLATADCIGHSFMRITTQYSMKFGLFAFTNSCLQCHNVHPGANSQREDWNWRQGVSRGTNFCIVLQNALKLRYTHKTPLTSFCADATIRYQLSNTVFPFLASTYCTRLQKDALLSSYSIYLKE